MINRSGFWHAKRLLQSVEEVLAAGRAGQSDNWIDRGNSILQAGPLGQESFHLQVRTPSRFAAEVLRRRYGLESPTKTREWDGRPLFHLDVPGFPRRG